MGITGLLNVMTYYPVESAGIALGLFAAGWIGGIAFATTAMHLMNNAPEILEA